MKEVHKKYGAKYAARTSRNIERKLREWMQRHTELGYAFRRVNGTLIRITIGSAATTKYQAGVGRVKHVPILNQTQKSEIVEFIQRLGKDFMLIVKSTVEVMERIICTFVFKRIPSLH